MRTILLVGLGGFIGSIFRYIVSRFIVAHSSGCFPWGTFIVNLSGCFLIGLVCGFAGRFEWYSSELRTLLIVGVCGGFTTFSTFSSESLILLRSGNSILFLLYILGSVMIGLLCTYVGLVLTSAK